MGSRRPLQVGIALLALWSAPACSLKERVRQFLQGDERGKTVVKVGGDEFSQADLERFFDTRLSDFRDPTEAERVKSNLLESFIEEKLLLHEAERHKIQPSAEAVRLVMDKIAVSAGEHEAGARPPLRDVELERSILDTLKMKQYVQDHLLKDVEVDPKECEDYYLKHLEEYVRNDVVHVREILIDDPALAARILALLGANRNKNFAELARMHSKAPSASEGGDLGSFQRGELPEEFEKAVFSLAPGTVSKIVRTRYGLHIFLVEEKILAHQQKLIEVQDEIAEKLATERQRGLIDRRIAALSGQIPIEIHRDRLDFKYIGTRFGGNTHE